MSYKALTLLAIVVASTAAFDLGSLLPCTYKEISGDLPSLGCIVSRLCYNHNATRATDFFGCYSKCPGEKEFLECQLESFDNTYLNSPANIDVACKLQNLGRLAKYAKCLGGKFPTAEGVTQEEAVSAVNKCQGKALGLKVKQE